MNVEPFDVPRARLEEEQWKERYPNHVAMVDGLRKLGHDARFGVDARQASRMLDAFILGEARLVMLLHMTCIPQSNHLSLPLDCWLCERTCPLSGELRKLLNGDFQLPGRLFWPEAAADSQSIYQS